MPRNKRLRLPDKLVVIPNADKDHQETWTQKRRKWNIPMMRGVLIGRPNSGKTLIVKNLILHQDPPFEEIVIVHCDPETKEYDDIDADILTEIPDPTEWSGNDVKTLCILDDLNYTGISKEQKKNLDRLFGYVSSHKNVAVLLTSQDPFVVPTNVRRMANLWILWKQEDMATVATVARRAGYNRKDFQEMFALLKTQHDSLWLDLTPHSPYPLRLNGDTIIQKVAPE